MTAALAVWLASRSSRPGAILAGFAVAVAIEVIAKHVVARPSLHLGSYHLAGFDHSFPSGHMTRTMYLALVAAAIFPRAAGALATGLVVVAVLLVASANHTPSDVVGGAALGALVAIVVNPRGDAVRTSR